MNETNESQSSLIIEVNGEVSFIRANDVSITHYYYYYYWQKGERIDERSFPYNLYSLLKRI